LARIVWGLSETNCDLFVAIGRVERSVGTKGVVGIQPARHIAGKRMTRAILGNGFAAPFQLSAGNFSVHIKKHLSKLGFFMPQAIPQ
jgi:hypothetical protein